MSLLKEKIELKIQEGELQIQQGLGQFPAVFRWVIVLAIVGSLPLYFVSKKISALYYGKKYENYKITAKTAFENALSPQINATVLFTAGENYSAITKISNPNIDLSLPATPFELHFFNQNQETVHLIKDKIFLLPDQSKYVFTPPFKTNQTIAGAEFKFSEDLRWKKKNNLPKVNLLPQTPNFYHQQNPQSFTVEGNFLNNSPYYLKQVRLVMLVYNANEKVITASQRDEFALKPFERRSYKQLWPAIFAENVERVEVYAETNILDNENVSLPPDFSGEASNLDRPNSEDF